MSAQENPFDLPSQVRHARQRMLFEHVEMAMLGSGAFAVVVAWLIHDAVAPDKLWPWLVLKLLVLAPRLLQARWFLRHGEQAPRAPQTTYRMMLAFMALDGLVWGAVGWGLTPVAQLELAVITISAVMGVSALAAFMNSMDTRAMACFVLPMMVPNVLHCLTRGDSLGLFGAASIAGFMVVMHLESFRAQRRITELLRLRFTSERVSRERAEALEQARLHSDARSRFLATVSHEMRTPLHGILGLARVLQQEQPRADQRQRMALIERSGDHLLSVINDILDFSKIEAGRMEIEARAFDMSAVLQEAAGVFQVLAQRKQLPLTLTIGWEGPCLVTGDPARVRQVLHNLLGNAVKFTDQGCVQLIARRDPHDDACFEMVVRDTGQGIAEADRDRVFEAFTQSHTALDRRHGGTGLGLSIARQLCQAMQGDLSCDSAVGVGSVFRATLRLPPVARQTEVEVFDDHGFLDSSIGSCVLLVEDNPVNVLVAEAVLANLGCQVHTVTDGQQAVDWLDAQQCDVVLMDCAMPVMNGLEASREIRRREQLGGRGRVPIVALTANLMANERDQCLQAGMDDYLPKPFTHDDIRQVLERVMSNAAVLRMA